MLAEFEEKQYEQLINIELTQGHNLLPLGQFQENFCGFDGALWTTHPQFWQYIVPSLLIWDKVALLLWHWGWQVLRPSPLPKGISIEILGELCEEGLDILIRNLPQIRFNVLIQYKRSEYMRSRKALEWKYWKRPYYRYRLVQWQLKALVRVARRIGHRAIVVYAAPSFYTISDLIRYANQQQLVANSNFRQALDLEGHQVYTFVAPGSAGIALSEPKKFRNDFHLLEEIRSLASRVEREPRSNVEYLRWLSKVLEQSVAEDLYTRELYELYFNNINYLEPWPLTQMLAKINVISWIIGTKIFLGLAV